MAIVWEYSLLDEVPIAAEVQREIRLQNRGSWHTIYSLRTRTLLKLTEKAFRFDREDRLGSL